MTYLLTIPSDFVGAVALLLLVGPIVLSLLIYWLSKANKSTKINKFLSKIFITPFPLEPLHPELHDEITLSETKNSFKKQLSYRIILIYGGIILFLLSNFIGEFYFILTDISLPVTQGNTGDMRVWSRIVFNSPFRGGWMGFFPWYGDFPLPPINLDSFHETWTWIFFTATGTDNPAFLDTVVWLILLGSFVSGLLFLIPLLFGVIRKSFLPSMFFFFTGMLTLTRGLFTCFSQAFKLEFASGSVTYGIQTITKENLESVTDLFGSFVLPLLLVVLIFFVVFIHLGRKLWKQHYPNHQFSHNWFMFFITLSFWGSLFILMV
ncbi:MAG: hypothetical protein ACXACP_01905 [Candidatus Hodarchaeales archaeon]|jgi:hypothetical protein